MEIQVGVQLACLNLPLKKALHTAARLGANAVEIDGRHEIRPQEMSQTGVRQLRKTLEDLNLRVCAVRFPTRRGYNVAEQLEERVAATKAAMDMAYQLGARVVVNQIGRVPEETDPTWDTLTDALEDLGRYGQRVGAWLAAETGSEDGSDLHRLLTHLAEGSVAVTLNPGNLIVNGFSAREATELLRDFIVYVTAQDGVRDLARGRGIQVALGRGSAELPELAGILEENRYRGYWTVTAANPREPIPEVENAIQYLKRLH